MPIPVNYFRRTLLLMLFLKCRLKLAIETLSNERKRNVAQLLTGVGVKKKPVSERNWANPRTANYCRTKTPGN